MNARRISGLLVTAGVALLLFAAPAAAQAPGAGIASTAHDFTQFNPTGGDATNTEDVGLCTFCHTPHKALQTKLLWNHTLSSNTFSWTDTTVTTNGTELPTIDPSWQGPSKFCLSCHDGSVAIGDINWFDKQGQRTINTTQHNGGPTDPAQIAQGAVMNNNHPVAHPFPANGSGSTYNTKTSGGEVLVSGWVADPSVNGIRLFNDDGAGNVSAGVVTGQTGIECSSCHDPHNGSQVQDTYFLRGLLTGSSGGANGYICLKCHVK